jgi:hypothetical protein
MKHHPILAILGGALFAVNLAHAAILTVDNKPGSVAMFTDFQAAYNAAQAGDTIMLAGSPTGYSAPTIYKRLHIVGPGYLFGENAIPGINTNYAYVSLTFARHNQFGDASGSSVSGVYGGIYSWDNQVPGASVPISVSRCRATCVLAPGASISTSLCEGDLRVSGSTSVRNCILAGSTSVSGVGNTFSNCTVVTSLSVSGDTNQSTSWSNIVFVGSNYTTASFASLKMGSVTHSIAVGNSILPGGRASFLPEGGGNLNGFNLADVFVSSGNEETRWMLKTGSPAIGTGFNGVDMGGFGGANPYRLSGVAPRPRITRFVVPAAATDATGLRFEVDAKAF